MPELPEVEHFRRMLLPLVAASQQEPYLQLELLNVNPPKTFISPDQVERLNQSNCVVKDIRRRGKLICLDLLLLRQQNGNKTSQSTQRQGKPTKTLFLFVHMGMTGSITTPTRVPCFGHARPKDGEFALHGSIKQQQPADAMQRQQQHEYPPKYTHLRFRAGPQKGSTEAAAADACFSDPRKFGKVCLSESDAEFESLSPDALDEFTDATPLVGIRTGIKAVLLDQKRVVSGVGNWVADEVLYQTEIHPDQTCLTETQAATLQTRLVDILTTAVACLEDGLEYPLHWLFHYRWAKKKNGAKDAKGRTIKFVTCGGRTSAVVPSIQKTKSQKNSAMAAGKRSTKASTKRSAKETSSANQKKGARTAANPSSAAMLNGTRKRKATSTVALNDGVKPISTKRRSPRFETL